jgi:hypothetical protein
MELSFCFFLHLAVDYRAVLPEQKAFREKIEKLTSNKLKGDFLSMSWLCARISHYAYDRNGELENYTLDDLAEFFRNPENIIDEGILGSMYETAIFKNKKLPQESIEKHLDDIILIL